MRHLHFNFICASFSLGLSIFLFGLTGWQVLLVGVGAEGVVIPIGVSLAGSAFLGVVLLMYALDGIRQELGWPRLRHAR